MKKLFKGIILILIFVLQALPDNIDATCSLSLLALGDINLGRQVGQEILKGNINYPFEKFSNVLQQADVIFANLESQITDQNGETQSPKSNLIFCAPPEAALTLKHANITVVSTANNHAYDYNLKGLVETIDFLKSQNIKYTGTIKNTDEVFEPAIIEKNGITIGVIAYTESVNMIRGYKSGLISIFDSTRAQLEIQNIKDKVDFVLISYHGGDEYKDEPNSRTKRNLKFFAECGANIVIGHHPHVPQGIEMYRDCVIFYSLGNTVFNQPQRYWTQRAFAALITFEKKNNVKNIAEIELIPYRAGFQPAKNLEPDEEMALMERIRKLSKVKISKNEKGYFIELLNGLTNENQ